MNNNSSWFNIFSKSQIQGKPKKQKSKSNKSVNLKVEDLEARIVPANVLLNPNPDSLECMAGVATAKSLTIDCTANSSNFTSTDTGYTGITNKAELNASGAFNLLGGADALTFTGPQTITAINQPVTLTIISSDVAGQVPGEELSGSKVLTINSSINVVDQISSYLNRQGDASIDVVKIISHGGDGGLLLGNQLFNQQTLDQRASDISEWKRVFTPEADMLLYGCSVASTTDGQAFVSHLAQLTGTDVAASTDTTGAGGDLVLEYTTGGVEAAPAGTQAQWNAAGLTLPDLTITYTLPGTIAGGKMYNILPGTAPANSTLKSVSVSGIVWSTTSGGYTPDLTFMVSPTATPVTGGSATGTKLSYFLGGKSPYGVISSIWNVSSTNTNEWLSGSQTSLPNQTRTPTTGINSTTPLAVNLGNQYLLVGNGYTGSSSWTGTVTVVYNVPDGDATATTLTSSTNPVASGQPVTFTATVANTSTNPGTPTGKVEFYDGTTLLGTGDLNFGVATFTTTSLAAGARSITAKYLATGSFRNSTSAVLTQGVEQAPEFTNAASASFIAGVPGTFQFTTSGYPTATYSVTTGTLPGGLNLASSGLLSGTPTVAGDTSVIITATNGIGSPASQSFDIKVSQLPVINSPATASFTNDVPGSFTVSAAGFPAPTFSIGQNTYFQTDFAALPAGWTLRGSATVTGGECVLTTATANQNGALILPKLGADSPGSFTANFNYTVGGGTGADGTSFNYGIVPASTTSNQNGMVTTGLAVSFIEFQNPRIDVRWNGNIIASVPNTFASTAKAVSIRLDGTGLLTVSYDGTQKLSVNLADTVNAANRSDWQFALGAATGASTNKHAIDNLNIVSNGVLPTGLLLDGITGVISGTPATTNSAGVQVFNLLATNSGGVTSQLFTLGLSTGAPVFTSPTSVPLVPGIAGAAQLAASGSAGPVTYGVGTTYFSSTLANAGTLPAGAYISGSALFNSNSLQLTQNVNSQNGRLQLPGLGDANPEAFSASYNYLAGGGSGADGMDFLYGPGGDPAKGLRVFFNEFQNDYAEAFYNNVSIGKFSQTLIFLNSFTATNVTVTPQGRLRVTYGSTMLLDVALPAAYQTDDKTLWAFAFNARTGGSNNFHTIKDLAITSVGVLPPGLTLNTSTGEITGTLGIGTAVDQYVPVTATNAAGTTVQYLKLDVSTSNLLPGQRTGTGTSVGGSLSLGVTGQEFRNLTAFASLTATGEVKVWGSSLNGGIQSSAPTGTGWVSITSNEKAFAALRADGSISAWGFSANGATGEPTGTGYVQIFSTRGAFAALKNDGSVFAWGNTALGGAFNATSTSSPTGTGFISIFASGGAFAALKTDGSIKAWGATNAGGSGAPTGNGYIRIVSNDYLSGSNSLGAFAAIKSDGSIAAWGNGANGGTGAPTGTGWVDIVASSKSFAAIRNDGLIVSWGDNTAGGTGEPSDTSYIQIYANPDAFVALRQNGSLAAWGVGASGATGAPTGSGYTQVFSTLSAFAALNSNGSISVWGNSASGGSGTQAPNATGYTSIASTESAFAALKSDGSISVWGNSANGGANGPSGTGWTQITSTGTAFTALKSDGTIFSWGSSAAGGTGAPTGNYLTVQSPTFSAPYFPLTAGAPTSFSVTQNKNTQIFPGIRGEGLSYTVTSGALPAGLTLDPVSGWVVGTAVQPGKFNFTISATGPAGSITQNYTLMVDSSLLPNQRQGAGAAYTIGSGIELPNASVFAGLTANGGIYAWGVAAAGGTGAPTGTGYTQLTSTYSAYAALKYDGSITAWGDTVNGAIGAPSGTGYKAIYSTEKAFAALKADGSISAWGSSVNGGSGAPTGTGYTRIFANKASFAAQKDDGSIITWGFSGSGGTGAPTGAGYTLVIPNNNAYAALKTDGSITAWGIGTGGGSGAPTGTGYTKIFASQDAYAALRIDGSIAVWGDASRGGSGAPSGAGFVDIWSSANGFAALKNDGSLTSWGATGSFDSITPTGTGYTQVFSTSTSFAALKGDGSVVSWGASDTGGTGAPSGTGYSTIYSNNHAFVALRADGSITAWGNTSNGGVAPTGSGYTQIFSRRQAFAAMKADGTISAWGSAPTGAKFSSPGLMAFSSIENATAVLPARQFGLTGNLPTAYVNTALATTTANLNGVAGYQVGGYGISVGSAVTAGSLPPGLALDASTGYLKGTPTTAGTYNFTITSYNPAGQASQAFTLEVKAAPATAPAAAPAFSTTKSIGYANYAINSPATYDLSATGTSINYAILAGNLPAGMTLNTATGIVSGTPTQSGNFQFTLAASNSKGVAVQVVTLYVNNGSLPNERVGQNTPLSTLSTGHQGVNQTAFAALQADGTVVTWGNSANGGAGATGVPTGAGYVLIAQTGGSFAALRQDGTIKAWGQSLFGGLGAPNGSGYTRIFANDTAFAALKADGSITAWGLSSQGGSGAPTGTGFTQIFSNQSSFAALKADGSITTWGNSNAGSTGAPTGTGFVTISPTLGAFAALKADGSIAAWGDIYAGGTGAPTGNGYTAIYSNKNAFAALRGDGSISTWGATPGNAFPGGGNFISVTANSGAFAALKQDGSITVWGDTGKGGSATNISASGIVGAPTQSGFVRIFSNNAAFAGLMKDGTIRSWGSSTTGGNINIANIKPMANVYSNNSAFVAQYTDGSLISWGNGAAGGTGTPTGTGYTQVFSTGSAFVAQKADGSLRAWGSTANGSLGAPAGTGFVVGSSLARLPYQQSGTTGELPTAYVGSPIGPQGGAGPNGYQVGALGEGVWFALTSGALPAGLSLNTATGYLTGTPTVAGSSSFTITSTSSQGTVSQAYTLEVKTLASVLLPGQVPGKSGLYDTGGSGQMAANSDAWAALKADGAVATWGSVGNGGSNGPTGTGYTALFSTRTAFAALRADGKITAWGSANGGTGAPTETGYTAIYSNQNAFTAIKPDGSIISWGNSTNGGGNAPSGTGYTGLVSNSGAFAALAPDGSIRAWGLSSGGGSGAPTGTGFVQLFSGFDTFGALRQNGTIAVWGNSANAALTGVPTESGFVSIITGDKSYAAMRADGSIVSWGNSLNGGTGEPTATGFTSVQSNSYSFAAMKADGSITAWGDSSAGGSGAPTGTGFVSIAAAQNAYAAIKADGSITAWGSSTLGGSGAPTGTGWTKVVTAKWAMAALRNDGSIAAWGQSLQGGSGAPTGTGFTKIYATGGGFAALRSDGTAVSWGSAAATPTATGLVALQSPQAQPPVFTNGTLPATKTGQAYWQTLGVNGVGNRYELTLGALPAGLTLDPTTGVLSGIVNNVGDYIFTIAASNPTGVTAQSFSIKVEGNLPPTFTSANNATFTVGTPGQFTFTSNGVPSVITYSVAQGQLPNGLLLNSNTGVLSGTPAAGTGGLVNLTIRATNTAGFTDQAFALSVNQAPAINSANNATFETGTAGTFNFTASGYPAPTFTTNGPLPGGVTLSSSGVLTGTPSANAGGVFAFTVVASNGIGSSSSQNFTLTVNSKPVFTSASSAAFVSGQSGTFTVAATGYPTAVTYSLAQGSNPLPAGLTFSSAGVLDGSPNATAGTYTVTLQATNGAGSTTQNFTINIGGPPAFTSNTSTSFIAGTSGSFPFTASGFPAPNFSITSGTLPQGVTLSGAGLLSGTPSLGSNGVFNFTVTASNGVGTDATQNFTLTVDQAPAITSANNATYSVGTFGSFTVTGTGFPAPTFSITTGTLPSGLLLDANTGVISGTPDAGSGGQSAVTITASNGVGIAATQNFTFKVNEDPAFGPNQTSTTFTAGTSGSYTFTATGFPSPSFSLTSGTLPQGVNLSSTGVLSGTPTSTSVGLFNIVVTASNGVGTAATQNFALTVNAPTTPVTITSANGTSGYSGVASTFQVVTTGNPAANNFSLTGTVPTGVTIDNTGLILIANTTAAGNYSFTVEASNGGGRPAATQVFSLQIFGPPSITSATSASFTIGTAGSFQFTASGNPNSFTFSTSDSLPAGLTLSSSGLLSGTPLDGSSGSSSINVVAFNGVSDASQLFSISIDKAASSVALALGNTGSIDPNNSVTLTATVSGGSNQKSGTMTFKQGGTVIGTASVNPTTGIATFTTAPLATGSYSFTAEYSGNSAFLQSSPSNTVTQLVRTVSATTVTSDANPATYQSTVTFTATVGGTGGTPTGTVDFFDGSTRIAQNVPMTGGIATFATSSLSAGLHSITAVYSGDTNFTNSTSGAFSQSVTANSSTTLVNSPSGTVNYNTAVTFTATVNGSVGTPTGTVQFYLNNNPVGSPVTLAFVSSTQATASYILNVPAGSLSISAAYSGDISYSNSNSNVVTQNVNFSTTTAVTSASPSLLGSTATFTARVTNSSGATTPTSASVSFYDGTTLLGTSTALPVSLTNYSEAVFSTTSLSAGSHSITAVYAGDPQTSFSNSTSPVLSHSVVLNTSTTVTATPASAYQNDQVTFTATVASTSGGATPTGTVTFFNGSTQLGTAVTLDNSGVATYTNTFANAGTQTITAKYSGVDGVTSTSEGSLAKQINATQATSTGLTTSANPAINGNSVTFTATITNNAGASIPTGSVEFYDSSTFLGSIAVDGSGTATLSTTSLANGDHLISAKYISNANAFADSTSTSISQRINQAPAITSATSANFQVGNSGSFNFAASGFPSPSFSTTDVLPQGVTLTSSGLLSGTPVAGTSGSYNINVVASNSVGSNATQSFTLNVNQPPAFTSDNFVTFAVSNPGTLGSFTLAASGFPNATFSTTTTLPSWLTLSNGVLSGTPTVGSGGTYTLNLKASNGVNPDATQTFTLTVNEAPAITSATSATFTVGTAGSFQVVATGQPSSFTFTTTSKLPNGVTLNLNSGILGGTPLAGTGGTYSISIQASNGFGSPATQAFTLTVNEAPAFTSLASATFEVGSTGSFTPAANGTPAPTIALTVTPPSGVTFTNGVLGGTPTTGTGGVYNLTFTATNNVAATPQAFTLTVNEAAVITGTLSQTFTAGSSATTYQFTNSGFPVAANFSTVTPLPQGLTLSSSGLLSGTPATGTGGVYNIVVSATNGVGLPDTKTFILTINEQPSITSVATATFVAGTNGSFQFASKGQPNNNFNYTNTGALPNGVTLSSSGLLSGIPASGTGGNYPITVSVSNGVGTPGTQSFTLSVNEPPVFTSPTTTSFKTETFGNFVFTAVGTPNLLTFSLAQSSISLPQGLALSSSGLLSGTPAAGTGGVYNITMEVSNGVGSPTTQNFSLVVNQPPAFTSANTATLTSGAAGSFTLTANGYPTTHTYSVVSGALPPGMDLDPNTGIISGTIPGSGQGTYTAIFGVSNTITPDATQEVTFTVLPSGGLYDYDATAKTLIINVADNVDIQFSESGGNFTFTLSNPIIGSAVFAAGARSTILPGTGTSTITILGANLSGGISFLNSNAQSPTTDNDLQFSGGTLNSNSLKIGFAGTGTVDFLQGANTNISGSIRVKVNNTVNIAGNLAAGDASFDSDLAAYAVNLTGSRTAMQSVAFNNGNSVKLGDESTDLLTFDFGVSTLAPLVTYAGGTIRTNSNPIVFDKLTLLADTLLDTFGTGDGSSIFLNSPDRNGYSLVTKVKSTDAVVLTGNVNINDLMTTTPGNLVLGDGVVPTTITVSANSNIVAQGGNLTFNSNTVVNTGMENVSFTADTVTFVPGTSIQGSGNIVFTPITQGNNIYLGAAATTSDPGMKIDQDGINSLSSQFQSVTFGSNGFNGAITIGNTAISNQINLINNGAGGKVYVTGNLIVQGVSPDGVGVFIRGSGATSVLSSNIITPGTSVNILDAVQVDAANILIDTTGGGSFPLGADINITGGTAGIYSTLGSSNNLTITAGSQGSASIGTLLGFGNAGGLGNFVNDVTITGKNIVITKANTISGALTLGDAGSNTQITLDGAVINGLKPTDGYSQFTSASLALAGTLDVLNSNPAFNPQVGTQFSIFNVTGPTKATGGFTGLPQGSIIPVGAGRFALTYTGGPGYNDVQLVAINNVPAPTGPVVTSPFSIAPDTIIATNSGVVTLTNSSGVLVQSFQPFEGYAGALSISTVDQTGDGVADGLVVGKASTGDLSTVMVIDAATGRQTMLFDAFQPAFLGGVSLSSGLVNINGQSQTVVIVGAGQGGGPHVKLFSTMSGVELASFFAFSEFFSGGVNLASADFDSDGYSDIVVGAGPGGGPEVRTFSGLSMNLIKSFMAYAVDFSGGVYVAAGDIGLDNDFEIVTGAGAGGGSHVKIWDFQTLAIEGQFMAYGSITNSSGQVIDQFFSGGVRVGIADVDGDGLPDVITGAGPGGGPNVKVFSGLQLDLLLSYFAGDPDDRDGVFVI